MKRAANPVVHNIAEGFGQFERKDKTGVTAKRS
jgi:hypothetical protein